MKTLIIILSLIITTSSFAQGSKREQKEAEKVAFITKYVGLTVEEAKIFWPVYNQFSEEKKALRKTYKPNKGSKKVDEITDSEIESLLDKTIEFKEKDVALTKKYHVKFKTVLPIKKIAKLYHAEKQFKNHAKRPGHPDNK